MDGNSSCIDELSSTSDSIFIPLPSNTLLQQPPPSRCRLGSGTSVILDCEGVNGAESRKLPSSKYKGVVCQPNGRWGAQIYEKHQRMWLGTYEKEDEAAMAYDVAVKRFRGRDAVTNFKQGSDTEDCDLEAAFLNSQSKVEIIDMLRKHTYYDELEQSKRKYFNGSGKSVSTMEGLRDPSGPGRAAMACHLLFQKEVTPSDVGKLNRFVIPKQQAEKHFPLRHRMSPTTSKGVLLNFIDSGGKVWRFRYSYWNSSHSYVLTRGWNQFVKEKSLRAGDIVSFHRLAGPEKQLHIKCMRRSWLSRAGPVHPVQMVRLFGVNIFTVSAAGAAATVVDDGKERDRGGVVVIGVQQEVVIGAL